jgi:hypothetical protein
MTGVGKGMFRTTGRTDSTSEDSRPLLDSTPATDHPPPASSSGNSSRDSTSINMQSAVNGSSNNQSDFVFIKIVARMTLQLIRKFWAFSSAAVLAIVLFYWLCGGIVAFAFVTFAVSGKSNNIFNWVIHLTLVNIHIDPESQMKGTENKYISVYKCSYRTIWYCLKIIFIKCKGIHEQ